MRVLRAVLVLLAMGVLAGAAERREFDVVVYGGTAGGVMAAVSAARHGLKTALVEPTAHLGGMVSGGLGWTDYGRKEVIGGMAIELSSWFCRKFGACLRGGRGEQPRSQ